MPEHANPMSLDRRDFLRSLGGGLVILLAADDAAPAQESGRGARGGGHELPQNVAAWLHIAPDGSITGFTGKVEVGQNIRTSLTQAVADELRCSPGSVRLLMGDTDLCPWDMGTFGSRTTPTMAPEMRKMASTARETLVDRGRETVGRSPNAGSNCRWMVKRRPEESELRRACRPYQLDRHNRHPRSHHSTQ